MPPPPPAPGTRHRRDLAGDLPVRAPVVDPGGKIDPAGEGLDGLERPIIPQARLPEGLSEERLVLEQDPGRPGVDPPAVGAGPQEVFHKISVHGGPIGSVRVREVDRAAAGSRRARRPGRAPDSDGRTGTRRAPADEPRVGTFRLRVDGCDLLEGDLRRPVDARLGIDPRLCDAVPLEVEALEKGGRGDPSRPERAVGPVGGGDERSGIRVEAKEEERVPEVAPSVARGPRDEVFVDVGVDVPSRCERPHRAPGPSARGRRAARLARSPPSAGSRGPRSRRGPFPEGIRRGSRGGLPSACWGKKSWTWWLKTGPDRRPARETIPVG